MKTFFRRPKKSTFGKRIRKATIRKQYESNIVSTTLIQSHLRQAPPPLPPFSKPSSTPSSRSQSKTKYDGVQNCNLRERHIHEPLPFPRDVLNSTEYSRIKQRLLSDGRSANPYSRILVLAEFAYDASRSGTEKGLFAILQHSFECIKLMKTKDSNGVLDNAVCCR